MVLNTELQLGHFVLTVKFAGRVEEATAANVEWLPVEGRAATFAASMLGSGSRPR